MTVSSAMLNALLTGTLDKDYKVRFASGTSRFVAFNRVEFELGESDKLGCMEVKVTFLYGSKPINSLIRHMHTGDALDLTGIVRGEVEIFLGR